VYYRYDINSLAEFFLTSKLFPIHVIIIYCYAQELVAQKMNISLNKRMIKTIVWSVALYGAETWTLRKEDIRRLEALEMWLWRKLEKVSWEDRMTNKKVLESVGENRKLVETI